MLVGGFKPMSSLSLQLQYPSPQTIKEKVQFSNKKVDYLAHIVCRRTGWIGGLQIVAAWDQLDSSGFSWYQA